MNSGFDPTTVGDWLRDGKTAIELMGAGLKLLPKGKQHDDLAAKIADAEASLTRSDASLAKALDYHLCQCSFPPQIMLWKEKRGGWLCPSADCGRFIDSGPDSFFIAPEYGV